MTRQFTYLRHVRINRQFEDIHILVLTYLFEKGPTSITRLMYMCEINTRQRDTIFPDMAAKGLIHIKSRDEILALANGPRKRKREGRLMGLHPVAKTFVIPTPLGKKYLEMRKRLDEMIKWPA